MATDNSSNEDVIQIGKLVFFRNVLLFENTAYQVSNICSMWVLNKSYSVKNEFPYWIFWLFIIGGILIYANYQANNLWSIVGGGLIFIAVLIWGNYEPETYYTKYALAFELNSGKHTYFTSTDKNFIDRAANSLVQVMSKGISNEEKLVLNFENKTINIEKATNSNIIGGNVSNSLVNSV